MIFILFGMLMGVFASAMAVRAGTMGSAVGWGIAYILCGWVYGALVVSLIIPLFFEPLPILLVGLTYGMPVYFIVLILGHLFRRLLR
jgi:hypothetical protein